MDVIKSGACTYLTKTKSGWQCFVCGMQHGSLLKRVSF